MNWVLPMAPIMRVPVAANHFFDMLAGMAAPALDVSAARERTSIDLFQIVFVQPGFTRAIDVVAVIEHETRPVRMPEKFEIHDLHLISRLPVVQIVNDLLARAEPNQIDIELVADLPMRLIRSWCSCVARST